MTTRPDHGRQIAAVRAATRLTLTDVARLSGLHRNSVVRVENRGELPRYSHAGDSIAEALEPIGVRFETRGDGYAVVFSPGVSA